MINIDYWTFPQSNLAAVLELSNLSNAKGVPGEQLAQNGSDVDGKVDIGNETPGVVDNKLHSCGLLAVGIATPSRNRLVPS